MSADLTNQPVHQNSVLEIQEATKWVMGSFAAIGAVLVGGLQISAIGTLGFDEPLSIGLAFGTMTVALLAVGLVLARAAHVLIPPLVTLSDLVGRELQARSRTPEADEFWASDPLLHWISRERRSLLKSGATGPHDLYEKLKNAQTAEGGQAEPFERDAKRLTDFAGLRITQDRYRRLVSSLLGGGAVVAACIVVFSWAVNSIEDRQEARITQPLEVRVVLTGTAESLPTAELPPPCERRELTGIAVAGELREPEVVIPPTSLCPAMRFTVTRDIGIAIPVLAERPSSSTDPQP